MTKKYNIYGMSCAACQAHVQKAALSVKGVKEANVNLIANTLVVDGEEFNDQDVMVAIAKSGYQAKPYIELSYNKKANSSLVKLIISIIFLILLLYVAMGHMINLPIPSLIDPHMHTIPFVITQMVLLTPIVILNFHYFSSGFKKLFRLHPNMDTLVALGSSAAIIYGIVIFVIILVADSNGDFDTVNKYAMNFYFESAGTILTLVSVGKYIENRAKSTTSQSLKSLFDIVGKNAIKIEDGEEKVVDVEKILPGDILKLYAGSVVPVDGKIIDGQGNFNESSLTGESLPVFKGVGDEIKNGTSNMDGVILFEATSSIQNSTVAKIVAMVEEAGISRAPIARLADKVSLVFVPIVLCISIITTLIWFIITKDISHAFNYGVSVLVISCPCALGLATPIAIMIGTGVAAKNNILLKDAKSLENLSHVDTIVFDKTGTITKGNFAVKEVVSYDDEFLSILYGLEKESLHPLAISFIKYAKDKEIKSYNLSKIETISGKGMEGSYNDIRYYAGNYRLIKEKLSISELPIIDDTVIYLASENKLLGYITFVDEIKEDSQYAIKLFNEKNITTIMLTGDNEKVANRVKEQVGIKEAIAGVLPSQKAEKIKQLENSGHRVAMVGDGINDAIALEEATIGIAIGAGSDIAISSADIILTRSSLLDSYNAYALSKKTMSNIKMNLFWAFFYNSLCIPLAAGVFSFANITLSPMLASIAMSISSICVVLNALRLKLYKRKEVKKMETIIKIKGMMCDHCCQHVNRALSGVSGVEKVNVTLANGGEAHVYSSGNVDFEEMKRAVIAAGYEVEE